MTNEFIVCIVVTVNFAGIFFAFYNPFYEVPQDRIKQSQIQKLIKAYA